MNPASRASQALANSAGPVPASGATAFYKQHAQPKFLEVGYASAPARIQAALAEEIEFLRRALEGSGRALELGCGNGRLLEGLRGCARAWTGIDFIESFLQSARGQRRLSPRTALAAASMAQLPFADGCFDVALCGQSTLGLLGEAKPAALREAARVVRRGGRVLVVVYSEFSVVPRVEWYQELHRRGLMAPIDWSRSGPELLVTEDGHGSECFRRQRLDELFRLAGLAPRCQRLGDIYWVVEAPRA